jgi:hypothetical protein
LSFSLNLLKPRSDLSKGSQSFLNLAQQSSTFGHGGNFGTEILFHSLDYNKMAGLKARPELIFVSKRLTS